MKTGDKVRFIHSKGEGIIRRFVDTKTVEVEIEDGFIVPFLKSEIVLVSSEESRITGSRDESISDFKNTTEADQGSLWLSFIPFNDKIFSMYLINDSGSEFLFALGEDTDSLYEGIASGILKPETSLKIRDLSVNDFNQWPEFVIQALQFRPGPDKLREPFFKKFKFKADSFFKNKYKLPVVNKEGHGFRITPSPVKINADRLTENMFSSELKETSASKITRPPKEVDLHIEKLVADYTKMSNSQIMDIQMKTFEKNLDNAIASGMDEIVFIHGIGNGVLKQQIHKSLSKNKNIRFFKDALKEKFGYGATLVRIK